MWITNRPSRLPFLFRFDRHFCSEIVPVLVRFFASNRGIMIVSRDRRKVFISTQQHAPGAAPPESALTAATPWAHFYAAEQVKPCDEAR